MQLFLFNAKTALLQVLMLYIIAGLGIAAERLHWFTEQAARQCTKLLLYVVTACVIVRSFVTIECTPQTLRKLAIALLAGVLIHVVGIGLSEPLFRGAPGKPPNDSESILHFASVYGNCGYMAVPLARAMAGEEGVFYCSIIILTFQVFSFTHGAFTIAGGVVGKPAGTAEVRFEWKKLVLNAGVISVLLGLPFFLCKIPVPPLIQSPLGKVADMQSPLAMLMFGTYLSRTRFNSIGRNKKIVAAIAIKLFGIPLVVLAALLGCGVRDPLLLNAVLISASAPSANNTVLFAANHGKDTGYAAQVVALISVLSVVTMPLQIAIGLSLAASLA